MATQTQTDTATESFERQVVVECKSGHALEQLIVPNNTFHCDMCLEKEGEGAEKKLVPIGSVMYGCRECNWDICETCDQEIQDKATAPWPEQQSVWKRVFCSCA
mmetsp:Transcript_53950/g.78814  ORF Transcript_53950/g.78814 Transcript_53950/m.78814 type:complete len:104 (+) Transcript_53950:56-367(+)